ncbi:MAG: DUF2285 domain-containing protein [Mesorhizobium sp.]|nr:MAG: DUF2285 domain-containing protein [Mesorhizobium sp.]TJV27686.1 MAG: DUF2285 domain-containing protein [Mesorhizobium sp.]
MGRIPQEGGLELVSHLPDPEVADEAPSEPYLTPYDHKRVAMYMWLLDAAYDDEDWRWVAKTVLHIDAEKEPLRAHRAWVTHLERARWILKEGHKFLFPSPTTH